MKLLLIRHGQTNENKERRYLGHYNSPLNDKGRQQVDSLVEKLKVLAVNPSICYSSDLLRTIETSEKICKEFSLGMKTYPELRELHFGDWECHTYNELNESSPEQLNRWVSSPFNCAPPNGETLYELGARVDHWIEQVILAKEDHDCVVVCHGGTIRWILSKWVLGDVQQFWNVNNVGHGEGLMLSVDQLTRKWDIISELTDY